MMKVLSRILMSIGLIGFILIGCNNSPKAKEGELNEAKEDVVNAKAELEQSKLDSVSDFNKYKESIQIKLVENEKKIGELRFKLNSKDKSTKELYEQQLSKLELKNTELKIKISEYQQGPEQKWEVFKSDFNKDMDDLGKSISNMAERNMKK